MRAGRRGVLALKTVALVQASKVGLLGLRWCFGAFGAFLVRFGAFGALLALSGCDVSRKREAAGGGGLAREPEHKPLKVVGKVR
jgi:hypothetical protein